MEEEDPLYCIHELLFRELDLESKRNFALTCRSANMLFRRLTTNARGVAKRIWDGVRVENEVATPYSITVYKQVYHFLAIYVEVNGVPLALRLLNSHIFICEIPNDAVDKIRRSIRFGHNMHEFNDYYIQQLVNIRFEQPYYRLGVFYIDKKRSKISLAVRNGAVLSEGVIYAMLYTYWQKYYNKRLPIYRYLITSYNFYGDDALNPSTQVGYFETPFGVRYIDLVTFLKNIG